MESFFVALVVFVFSLFVPVGSAGAQKSVENEIDVSKTYPNVTYKEIFRRFPLLDSIALEFSNGSPSFMTWFSSDLSKGRDWQRGVEYFDLAFEGDLYILKQFYNIKELPILPKSEVNYLDSFMSQPGYRPNAVIRDDSVTYRFIHPPFLNARYKGDIGVFRDRLIASSQTGNFGLEADSLLIFQGIVGIDGNLEQLELVVGSASDFSDLIIKIMKSQEKEWRPMIKDGRPLPSLVDICVRFGEDRNLTVSATGRGRILKIKDVENRHQLFY
ncbi:hypothetical protein [Sphingobacterium sp. SYP-B4668]|uniref:hypothetical protein n=1 Tax=Sphingobacterium sp. SYP-B4668 TaxID=2996035 RepID=UPI0022DE9486|nr:hypothetical protein [Sphingobacterium sp. SYP-B4668]